MLAQIIGGFITILTGVILVGPLSTEINSAAGINSSLYNSTSWGATTLKMIPGFFSIGILAVGIAVCYSCLRQAGIV